MNNTNITFLAQGGRISGKRVRIRSKKGKKGAGPGGGMTGSWLSGSNPSPQKSQPSSAPGASPWSAGEAESSVPPRIHTWSTDSQISPPAKASGPPKPLLSQEQVKNFREQRPEDLNFDYSVLPSTILMDSGEVDIVCDVQNPLTMKPGSTNYHRAAVLQQGKWHQVVVHHQGAFDKDDILLSLYAMLKMCDFYPVGYREFNDFDVFFLTYVSRMAILTLLDRNLKLLMLPSKNIVLLSVRVGVGNTIPGQLDPLRKIESVVRDLLENAMVYGNQNTLNMANFGLNSEFKEMVVNLGHLPTFSGVINAIKIHDAAQYIKAFNFSNNFIERLLPLKLLEDMPMRMLDLSENAIAEASEFTHLAKLKVKSLRLAGNPIAKLDNYTSFVGKLMTNVCVIDEVQIRVEETKTPAKKVEVKTEGGDAVAEKRLIEVLDEPLEVGEGELIKVHDSSKFTTFRQYKNSDKWHQVTVHHNGRYSRSDIVRQLYTLFEGHDFYACYYTTRSQYDEFYVLNNFDALEILVQNKLVLKFPGSDEVVVVALRMNCAAFKQGQVDVVSKIQRIVADSFSEEKMLDLSRLGEMPAFSNVALDTLSSRVLSQILLWASRKVGSQCAALRLNNNGISSCQGMYPLVWFTKLKALDLQENQLSTFEDLAGIPISNKVNAVWLNGNPLAQNVTLMAYIRGAKRYFAELEELDGSIIPSDAHTVSRQNFLCQPEAYSFVEGFLRLFFPRFDTVQKKGLKDFYHTSAIFSLSFNFDPSKVRETFASRIGAFRLKSRNILKLVDFGAAAENVVIGGADIVKHFQELMPSTEHDIFSFNIDVVLFTPHCIVLTINGIVKDKPMVFLEDEICFDFTRTFAFAKVADGQGVCGVSKEYKITNDMLLLRNLLFTQTNKAFIKPPNADRGESAAMTADEKERLLVVFQEMTGLNRHMCLRCLEESCWIFKLALNICLKLFEEDRIPEDAFEE